MKLTFFGTLGEIEEKDENHAKHTAILLETHGKKILLDCGENWQGLLARINPDFVWISHAHPDHAGGLSKGFKIFTHREAAEQLKEFEPRIVSESFEFDGIKAKIRPTLHSIKAPSAAIRIETDAGPLIYSSDVIGIRDREEILEGAKFYIGDGSFIFRPRVRRKDAKIFGHTSIRQQIRWCEKFGIPIAIFTHFGKEAVEMDERKLRKTLQDFSKEVRVITAYDGMEIEFSNPVLPEELMKLSDVALIELHKGIHEQWKRRAPGEIREDLLNQHLFIIKEMERRGLKHEVIDDLDEQSLRLLGGLSEKTWERLRAIWDAVEDFIFVPDYVSLTGGFVYHRPGRKPNDLDIVFREYPRNLPLENLISEQIHDKANCPLEIHWIYEPRGPNWDHVPLYDACFKKKPFEQIRLAFVEEVTYENKARSLRESSDFPYDFAAVKQIFEKTDDEIILFENCISLAGDFLLKPEGGLDDLHLLIRWKKRDPNIDLKAHRQLWYVTNRNPNIMYGKDAERRFCFPFFDLVLKKKPSLEIVRMKEERFKKSFYLSIEPEDILILVPPHGQLIYEGEKHMIVKSQRFEIADKPLYLAEGEYILGIIVLEEPFEIDLKDFAEYRPAHKIKDIERQEWWPEHERFWAWRIREFKKFDPPKRFKRAIGPQVIQKGPPEFIEESEAIREAIAMFREFTPMKAAVGYRVAEYTDIDELWTFWAKTYLINRKIPVAVEVKFDGIRYILQKRGDRVGIFTEDKWIDRADFIPDIKKEMLGLPVNEVILDAEIVWWKEGRPIPRREMAAISVGKEPIVGEDIRVNVFDCLWYEGRDLTGETWEVRQSFLKKVLPKDLRHLKRVRPILVRTKEELLRALEKVSKYPGSEGAMLKVVREPGSRYDITGKRTYGWAKFKLAPEISVQIIGRYLKPNPWASIKKKPPKTPLIGEEAYRWFEKLRKPSDTWIYNVAILVDKKLVPLDAEKKLAPADITLRWVVHGKPDPLTGKIVTIRRREEEEPEKAIGEWRGTDDPRLWEMGLGFKTRERSDYAYAKTYAARLKPTPKLGDIISVQPVLLREWKDEEGRTRWSWTFPAVKNVEPAKRKPDDIETIRRIAKVQVIKRIKEAELPGFKLDDAYFHLERWKQGKQTGILSAIERKSIVNTEYYATTKSQDGIWHSVGRITFEKPRKFKSFAEIPPGIIAGLDEPTRRGFRKVKPLWYFPIVVLEMFEEPKRVQEMAKGRMIVSRVVIEEARRRKELPTRGKQRERLMREIGDWYMITQPKGRSFPGVVVEHQRGLWFPDDIDSIKKQIKKGEGFEELWRRQNMQVLRTSLAQIKRDAQEAADKALDVSAAVRKHLDKKYPGDTKFLDLLNEDRVVNLGNAHKDLRMLDPSEMYLVGWTLDTPSVILQFLKSERIEPLLRDKFIQHQRRDNILCQPKCESELCDEEKIENLILVGISHWEEDLKESYLDSLLLEYFGPEVPKRFDESLKMLFSHTVLREILHSSREVWIKESPQPLAWLTLVTKKAPEFWAYLGQIGATKETAGRFVWDADIDVVYGVQKSDAHEYFFFFRDRKLHGRIGGRWMQILIPGRPEYKKAPLRAFWLLSRPDEQRPYIMTHRIEEEAAKAKADKIDMIWNWDTLATLEKMNYFKEKKLIRDYEQYLKEFKKPEKEEYRYAPKRKIPEELIAPEL